VTGDATREDDGTEDSPSDTAVIVRFRGRQQLIELRDLGPSAELVIGRSSSAGFVADDERVSRRHLRIRLSDGALLAIDLGSRNGSTLNGRRLSHERSLEPGDELTAGPVRVTVCGLRRAGPVANEDEVWTRLSAEVERATRFQRPLSLIGLRLEGAAADVQAAAQRVAGRLGRLQRIGEYAPGAYVVVLPETAHDEAVRMAAELAGEARAARVGAEARAAAVPESGRTASELVAAALKHGLGAPPSSAEPPSMIAEEPAMRAMLELARRAALSDATVLLIGETGSGKEVVAAEIHRTSVRAKKPYVRLNCASLPSTLLEPELFGHERGAFTGADKRRIGFIEAADGGTLLLDEIGELPLEMQSKLLRVLEEGKLTRVGGSEEVAFDVRFLAATHRDLDAEAAAGRFRQDLFFRINTITLRVPPLRERPHDLPLLAHAFLERASAEAHRTPPRMSPAFLATLARYPWPGNVRELRNVIERAVVLGDGAELTPDQLPHRVSILEPTSGTMQLRDQVDELEKRNLIEALREHDGNRTHAARSLGISRRSLLYKLKKYGIE
jgi:two-component system, NtrC family, response regulator AtoC